MMRDRYTTRLIVVVSLEMEETHPEPGTPNKTGLFQTFPEIRREVRLL